MLKVPTSTAGVQAGPVDQRMAFPVMIVVLQIVAAVFFLIDGFEEELRQARHGIGLPLVMECVIGLALLGGVILTSTYIARLTRELRFKEQSLARAQGAFADHVSRRFAEWKLSPGEREVALFTLKGCDIAEIARLRGAATGTVRSQLSQIYAKAAVTSQAMLIALFVEDLLDLSPDKE